MDGADNEEILPGGNNASTNPGSQSEDTGLAEDVFTSPVDVDTLKSAHRTQLENSGSITFNQEVAFRSDDIDGLPPDETTTARFNLTDEEAIVERTTTDYRITKYRDGVDEYERVEESGTTEYGKPSDMLPAEEILDSYILSEFRNITLDHQMQDGEHVYTASGVDTLSDEAFDPSTEFTEFEFRAVVTNDGLLRAYSYTLGIRLDDGRTYTVTVDASLSDIGSTVVQEPAWVDEARSSTN